MFNKILIFFILLTSSVSHAQNRNLIPCYDEMFDLLSSFVEETEGSMNIVIKLQNESSKGLKDFELKWKAPAAKESGVTFTTTVVSSGDQCLNQFLD